MSEYFSEKDGEQSFEMPTDNQSGPVPDMNQDAGQPQSTPYQSSGASEGGEGQNQDMIYMVVMAIIIFVMIYSLYSMFFSGGSDANDDKTNTAPIVENVNQPVKEEAPIPVTPPVPVQQSVEPETTTQQVSSTDQKKIDNNVQELIDEQNYLTAMVRKLSSSNQDVQNRFNDLESEIDDLVSKNETMQKQIEDLQKKLQPKETVSKPKALTTYTVEAVVEGRAWLVSSTGTNKTVKVGDKLTDYGNISKIDTVNSIVYTTSNRQIKVN